MASYLPGTTPAYPDVVGGQLTQTYGNPVFPGTLFTGPLLAGSIQGSDGTNTLGGVGETQGTANVGFVVMGKSCTITQATNNGATGQYVCPIVVPAQSQILRITLMVTAAWTTTTTLGIGTSASARAIKSSRPGRVVAETPSNTVFITFMMSLPATILPAWADRASGAAQRAIRPPSSGARGMPPMRSATRLSAAQIVA